MLLSVSVQFICGCALAKFRAPCQITKRSWLARERAPLSTHTFKLQFVGFYGYDDSSFAHPTTRNVISVRTLSCMLFAPVH